MLKNKICIGTSNFGKKYGYNKDKFNSKELNKLFKYLKKNNIHYLDSAEGYDNHRLLKRNINNFKLIYKINFLQNNDHDKILSNLKNILESLNLSKFECLLIHGVKNLSKQKLKKIFIFLNKIKRKNITKFFGASIYDEKDLRKIYKLKYKLDIIQLPINIFDRSFINNKTILSLKKRGVKFHARSIFLQGTLLIKNKKLPNYFDRWKNLFNKWDDWHIENNAKKIETCINFMSQLKFIDKIIIGINDLKQLKEIIKTKKSKFPTNIYSKDQKLLKPYLWKL